MSGHVIPSYDAAYEMLCEYTKNENLVKHGRAVELCMRALARHFGEDEERWATVGILHDFDYEKYPTIPEHATEGGRILREAGWPDDIINAILGHAEYTGVPRVTKMAKALFAVDELSGFLVGCALVRLDKSFKEMKVSSVKKKMKDKAFCRAVNRDEVSQGAQELGMELDDLIQFLIEELYKVEGELGLGEAAM
ncbi:MAG: HDIG domain-containing protein [bacterium]|nr:HDIG domain-containing protein [bacterium]